MIRHSFSLRDVKRLLARAAEAELSEGAIRRLRWFAYVTEHDGNVSLACRHFGIARTTYLRWAERFDPSDPSSLEDESRSPRRVREPETDPRVIEMIRELREEQPFMGKECIAAELAARGVRVSASTVGRTIARYGFFFGDTPAHRRKRSGTRRVPPALHVSTDFAVPISPEPLAS